MKMVYRILAYLIALAVALQAAFIAIAFFGLGTWIDNGGVLDKASAESAVYPGNWGLEAHGTVGVMVIPIIGLLLLVSSFFTKVKGAVVWALIVLGCIVLQVVLGIFSHAAYALGFLHGLFAFAVLATATVAATRMARAMRAEPATAGTSSVGSTA
jgi:hypothetical protein